MEISAVKEFLLYSLIINYAMLFIWFGIFSFAHDFLYSLHERWFKLSNETFDAIHYAGMAFYKILIFLFNLAPLVVLALMDCR
jgi:hypothetical protein